MLCNFTELWILNDRKGSRAEVFEMMCLKRGLEVYVIDWISNGDAEKETGVC